MELECKIITRAGHDPALETGYEYPSLRLDGKGFSDEFKEAVKRIGGSFWLNEIWLPNALPMPTELTGFVAPVAPPFDPATIGAGLPVNKAWYAYKPLDQWAADYDHLS